MSSTTTTEPPTITPATSRYRLTTPGGAEVARLFVWDQPRGLLLALVRDPRCPAGSGYWVAEFTDTELMPSVGTGVTIHEGLTRRAELVIDLDGTLAANPKLVRGTH